jgi:AraC family transcriptional regulator
MNFFTQPVFDYPPHQSVFDTQLVSSGVHWGGLMVERVYTTPGYNTSKVREHIVGIHLGAPVTIIHQRNQREKIHRFRPGDILFTTAGTPIHFAHAKPVDGLYISIPPAHVEAVGSQLDPDQSHHLRDDLGTSDAVLHNLGRAYLQELQSPGFGGALYIEALTTQLIVQLLRRFREGNPTSASKFPYDNDTSVALAARLRPAIDLINDCYAHDLSLAQIAAAVHLSPYHFSRLFKRAYGVTPHQYLIQQRVEAAQYLLTNINLTLQEIALEVGFANHSHLTVHFKRLTGQTPRQYGNQQ